jgi:hypothetical protein
MDICAYPRISMDISMDTYGNPWISMDMYGYLWISIDIHGYP